MKYALWKYPIHTLAYGFGTGLIPVAPGTFGCLVGIALFWFLAPLGAGAYAGIVLTLFVAGIFICGQTARDMGAIDPGFVVYDEIVGFLVAMYLMPREWRWIAAGFVVFRIFDVWIPFPIQAAEEIGEIGTAIMADDIIAGVYTLVILQIARMVHTKFVRRV